MLEFTKAVSRTKWRYAERCRVEGKQARRGVRVPEHGSTSRFESESNSRSAVLARLLILLLLALAVPRADYAQVLYGSLTGNVTDPAGAIVSGAKVEALNVNTGVSKIVNTDDRGVYLFSDLQPGASPAGTP